MELIKRGWNLQISYEKGLAQPWTIFLKRDLDFITKRGRTLSVALKRAIRELEELEDLEETEAQIVEFLQHLRGGDF